MIGTMMESSHSVSSPKPTTTSSPPTFSPSTSTTLVAAPTLTISPSSSTLKQKKMISKFTVTEEDEKKGVVKFDPEILTARLQKLTHDLKHVDVKLVVEKVHEQMAERMTPRGIDELAEDVTCHLTSEHYDYGNLAARIAIENMQKDTMIRSFSEAIELMHKNVDKKSGKAAPMISDEVYEFILEHKEVLNAAIVPERDFLYGHFGFKTLALQSYLRRIDGKLVETPQYMHMRVACGIHIPTPTSTLTPERKVKKIKGSKEEKLNKKEREKSEILSCILESYNYFSNHWLSSASPTLFNSASPRNQLSSCFLIAMKEDSIDGIYDTLKSVAKISKYAGGIGVSCSNIRAFGSYIAGTNGYSNGLVPMLRVYNNTARYVDQGGGKRKGAFAIYLEPWHADIEGFLEIRKNHGSEEHRARDLFTALWVTDLFMKRVEADEDWSLMCPNDCPGLQDTYGEEHEKLYINYERAGKVRKVLKARELWAIICDAQTESGTPYILFKDSCNKKSNQKNLGTIRSSNLCTEIIQFSSPEEIAVCNLASLCLKMFVDGLFNFAKLKEVVKHTVRNLNKIIDINYYPVKEAERSNLRHRPIGIGVQGLADVFFLLRLPYDSDEARLLNVRIFETILFAAYEASHELALKDGPYSTFEGSPASQGLLAPDLWLDECCPHLPHCTTPAEKLKELKKLQDPRFVVKGFGSSKEMQNFGLLEPMWDWQGLRKKIVSRGLRNSLLVAPMPTATSSSFFGSFEGFEPMSSNIFLRRTLSGEYPVVSKYLVDDLSKIGLWSTEMKHRIIHENGSIQNIESIPADIKAIFRTTWEIKQRKIIDLAAERSMFLDQSMSISLHVAEPNYQKLTTLHFYAWKKGLKTGMYYLRSRPSSDPLKFSIDKESVEKTKIKISTSPLLEKPSEIEKLELSVDSPTRKLEKEKLVCSLTNREGCTMCSS